MIIGEDTSGIGAVAWIENVDAGVWFLKAVAVARRHRGKRGEHANELFLELSNRVLERADIAGEREVILYGWVHTGNWPMKHWCERHGFAFAEMTNDPDHEHWTLTLQSGALS